MKFTLSRHSRCGNATAENVLIYSVIYSFDFGREETETLCFLILIHESQPHSLQPHSWGFFTDSSGYRPAHPEPDF